MLLYVSPLAHGTLIDSYLILAAWTPGQSSIILLPMEHHNSCVVRFPVSYYSLTPAGLERRIHMDQETHGGIQDVVCPVQCERNY